MINLAEKVIEFSFTNGNKKDYFNVNYEPPRRGIEGLGHTDFDYLLNEAFSRTFNPKKRDVKVLFSSNFPDAYLTQIRERAKDYSRRNGAKVTFSTSHSDD